MKIECPHCRQRIALDNNAPSAFKCPTCSGRIELQASIAVSKPLPAPTEKLQEVVSTKIITTVSEGQESTSPRRPSPPMEQKRTRPARSRRRASRRSGLSINRKLTLISFFVIFCLGGLMWLLVGGKNSPTSDLTVSGLIGDASLDRPFVNSLGMEFVPIQVNQERILFCRWETRVSDYQKFRENRPGMNESWKNFSWGGLHQTSEHPVVMVNLKEAKEFCQWLSAKEGVTYRLPTLFEWCVAAGENPPSRNASETPRYPWRNSWPPPKSVGNFAGEEFPKDLPVGFIGFEEYIRGWRDPFPATAPVASFSPNRFGIFDMFGNIMELTITSTNYDINNKMTWSVGACWTSGSPSEFRSLITARALDTTRTGNMGFRVVLDVPNSKP